MFIKSNMRLLIATTSLIVTFLACKRDAPEIDGHGRAEEWNGMSKTEQSTFIEGYTSGYGLGSFAACENADKLFESKPPWFDKDGVPNNPVTRCQKALDSYSRMGSPGKQRPDYSMYSNVISEFYAKYPKYNNVPFAYLMVLLSDKGCTSAEQVFQKLEKHDLQMTF